MIKVGDKVKLFGYEQYGTVEEIGNLMMFDYPYILTMDDGTVKMFTENQLSEI
jgi:hypothetical protein